MSLKQPIFLNTRYPHRSACGEYYQGKRGCNLRIIAMFILLVVSYYFMALSLKRLSVSVAYAIWEVLGAVCIVGLSVFYFNKEPLWTQKLGIALSFCGIGLINYAELCNNKTHKES